MSDFDDPIRVRQGAQLNLQITQGDATSESATLILRNQETLELIETTAIYEDGVANIMLDGTDTATIGIYDYQVNENFTDADPIKYPDPNDCDGDCIFPTIEICEALDAVEGSS